MHYKLLFNVQNGSAIGMIINYAYCVKLKVMGDL